MSPVGLGGRAVETMPVSILSSATQVRLGWMLVTRACAPRALHGPVSCLGASKTGMPRLCLQALFGLIHAALCAFCPLGSRVQAGGEEVVWKDAHPEHQGLCSSTCGHNTVKVARMVACVPGCGTSFIAVAQCTRLLILFIFFLIRSLFLRQ